MDVRDPTAPNVQAVVPLGEGGARAVEVAGGFAHVGTWTSNLSVVDVTDPATAADSVQRVSDLGSEPIADDVAVDGHITWLALGVHGIGKVILGEPPSAEPFLTELGRDDYYSGVALVQPGTVVVASWSGVLTSLSETGAVVATLNLFEWKNEPAKAVRVAVSGSRLHIAGGFSGLHVAEVAESGQLYSTGQREDLGGDYIDVVSAGSIAIVADVGEDRNRVVVFETGNVAEPEELASWQIQGRPRDLDLEDGLLFVAAEPGGMQIWDVSCWLP